MARFVLIGILLLVQGLVACDTQDFDHAHAFPPGDTLYLQQIAPRSPGAARDFPDSLLSGELPHVFDGGYGHIGVMDPPRSFWNVLESATISFDETARARSVTVGQFYLELQFATFTDGIPYRDASLAHRCKWTTTGRYGAGETGLSIVVRGNSVSGTIDEVAQTVIFDTLPAEGCRLWAYEGKPYRLNVRDVLFRTKHKGI